MSQRPTINRELIARVFFFACFAFLLYQLFLLARPFIGALLLAVMLAITFYPVYKRIHRTVASPTFAALGSTAFVILAGLLPLLGALWITVHEAGKLIPTMQSVIAEMKSGQSDFIVSHLPFFLQERATSLFDTLKGMDIDLEAVVMENIQDIGYSVSSIGGFAARNAIFIFFKGVVMLLTLFFTFRDGLKFLDWLIKVIPLEQNQKEALAKNAYETFRAVSVGVFITAAVQGFTAMIGFMIAGVRLPVLLGIATGFVSLIGASFIVTLPVAIFVLTSSKAWGIFLLLWGSVLVGFMDNLIRPILIGSRARMPFFLVFFSILGGLKAYGLLGIVLGPVLVASILTFIRLYREAYHQ